MPRPNIARALTSGPSIEATRGHSIFAICMPQKTDSEIDENFRPLFTQSSLLRLLAEVERSLPPTAEDAISPFSRQRLEARDAHGTGPDSIAAEDCSPRATRANTSTDGTSGPDGAANGTSQEEPGPSAAPRSPTTTGPSPTLRLVESWTDVLGELAHARQNGGACPILFYDIHKKYQAEVVNQVSIAELQGPTFISGISTAAIPRGSGDGSSNREISLPVVLPCGHVWGSASLIPQLAMAGVNVPPSGHQGCPRPDCGRSLLYEGCGCHFYRRAWSRWVADWLEDECEDEDEARERLGSVDQTGWVGVVGNWSLRPGGQQTQPRSQPQPEPQPSQTTPPPPLTPSEDLPLSLVSSLSVPDPLNRGEPMEPPRFCPQCERRLVFHIALAYASDILGHDLTVVDPRTGGSDQGVFFLRREMRKAIEGYARDIIKVVLAEYAGFRREEPRFW